MQNRFSPVSGSVRNLSQKVLKLSITEVDGVGDMKHGDLSLDECFDGAGVLSYRYLSELYAAEVPGYNMGDEAACVGEL